MSGKRFTNCPTCGGNAQYVSANFKAAGIVILSSLEKEDILSDFTNTEIKQEFMKRFGEQLKDLGLVIYVEKPVYTYGNAVRYSSFAHLSEVNKFKPKE